MDEPWPSDSVYICSWKSMLFSSSDMAQIYQPVTMVSIWGSYSSTIMLKAIGQTTRKIASNAARSATH